jgi:hypothetical protein
MTAQVISLLVGCLAASATLGGGVGVALVEMFGKRPNINLDRIRELREANQEYYKSNRELIASNDGLSHDLHMTREELHRTRRALVEARAVILELCNAFEQFLQDHYPDDQKVSTARVVRTIEIVRTKFNGDELAR